jgi:carbamate kinase
MPSTTEIVEDLKDFEDKQIRRFKQKEQQLKKKLIREKQQLIKGLEDLKNRLEEEEKEKIQAVLISTEKEIVQEIKNYEEAAKELGPLFEKNKEAAIKRAKEIIFKDV